ncbi:putative 8-amino-7-oxononanoate synthase [Alphaproteobacteria bacterium]|nr:putative 8-amino-7-oxononanoate synthase [Alphaproteobacteria bacterium]
MKQYRIICESLKASSDYRELQNYRGRFIDFSTNDYLNLGGNPEILEAAYEAGRKYGCGSTGSRLLSGNKEIFEEFEEQIAHDKNTEAALIFNSGYQANMTVLSALCDERTLDYKKAMLFFDKLNHASLYKAADLCKCTLKRYPNNDQNALEDLLKKHKDEDCVKFIVSETVFGMDGNCANLAELIRLAREYNALLYLDEAHATGVFGHCGYGLSTDYDLSDITCVIMGTFSKALGVSGAYVACFSDVKDYLLQKCSGLVYSTAPSPLVVGAAQKSWELVGQMNEQRKKLLETSEHLRVSLAKHGFDTMNSCSHIIPIKTSSSSEAMKYKELLANQGILVSAVRRPTVPTPRLRLALTLEHTKNDRAITYFCNQLYSSSFSGRTGNGPVTG